jgi:signal peptidase II
MVSPRLKWIVVLAVVAATIGCDRATKELAVRRLAGEPRHSFLADTVRLEYIENRGGFLGLGGSLSPRWRTGLFAFGTAAMLVGIGFALTRHGLGLRWLVGLSLLWAGGAANLIDRLAKGSVVDFLNVGLGPLRTGIFNVADMAIMTGAALLILGRHAARGPRREDGLGVS